MYLVGNLELPFYLSEIQNTVKISSRNNHLSTESSSPKREKREPQITKKTLVPECNKTETFTIFQKGPHRILPKMPAWGGIHRSNALLVPMNKTNGLKSA